MRPKPNKLNRYRLLRERTKNMSTTAADLLSFSSANSKTTTTWARITDPNAGSVYPILENSIIRVSHPDAAAIVMQPFGIEVRLVGNVYVASSNISTAYDFGETPKEAIRNYLELLVDKLTWFEKHKVELSPAIRQDFHLLESYVRIV